MYYEVARPHHFPVYHEVMANPPADHAYRFAVLEDRPNGLFHNFTGGYKIRSDKTTLHRAGTAFIAAEGTEPVRALLLRSLLLLSPS